MRNPVWLFGCFALLVFAVVPGLPRPFTVPKLYVLGVMTLLAAAYATENSRAAAPRSVFQLAVLWPAITLLSAYATVVASRDAIILSVLSSCVLLALCWRPLPKAQLSQVAFYCGAATSVLALLQSAQLDPFALFGFRAEHPGERARIYATLGNPDFVAAFLGATVFLGAGVREPYRTAGVATQLVALVAIRSFASVLAMSVGAVVFLALAPQNRKRAAVVAALAIAAMATAALTTRSVSKTFDGRLYTWRIAASHAKDAPVIGAGPGSFATLWPFWQGAEPENEKSPFYGPQDHAHSDYLEWAVELGLLGTLARLALIAVAFGTLVARRKAAIAAACAALLVRAAVDFPLSRPVELCLLILLLTTAWGNDE